MVSQVLFPELSNASVPLVAAVVYTLWSPKSKVGACMRVQQELSINFCFAFLSADWTMLVSDKSPASGIIARALTDLHSQWGFLSLGISRFHHQMVLCNLNLLTRNYFLHLFTLPLFRGKYWWFWLPAAKMFSHKPANLLAWDAYLLDKHTWVQKQTPNMSNATSLLSLFWPSTPSTHYFLFLDSLFFFSMHWSYINVWLHVWRVKDSIKHLSNEAHPLTSLTSPDFLMKEVRTACLRMNCGLWTSPEQRWGWIFHKMEKLEDFSHKSMLFS